MGHAKQKRAFKHTQNAQIQVHPANAQSHSGYCSSLIHSIVSSDSEGTVRVLIRLCEFAGGSGPLLSAYA